MSDEQRKRAIILSAVTIEDSMRKYLRSGDYIVACDAGYLNAQRLGIKPDLLIGDFDSTPNPVDADIKTIVLPHIKDDTDTYYAANMLFSDGYKEVVMLGALGGARIEHTFANIATALFLAKKGVDVCMADERSELHILTPGKEMKLARSDWKYLSLFPLDSLFCGIEMHGVFYPLSNAQLQMHEPVGVSNEFVQDMATVSCTKGFGLVVLSRTDS